MSQYFALQSQLAQRLRTRLDSAGLQGVAILSPPQATSLDAEIPAPCIFITHEGYAITEASSSRKQARITQQWHATVCVRHMVASPQAMANQELAGTLADLLFAALIGWQPTGYSPIAINGAAKPDRDEKHYWLLIAIDAETVYHAAP